MQRKRLIKKFDGVIHIAMSESNSADLQFKQKHFTVNIDSTYADSDDDDNSTSSSDEKVTRDKFIDKIESYEGSTLDTDNYTYKESEKNWSRSGLFFHR